MRDLCEHEIEILQECAGEREPRPWGAAVGAALGYLRGSGYMEGNTITNKGHATLKRARETEAPDDV